MKSVINHAEQKLVFSPIRAHHALDASVLIPASKSITNRALILAALADGCSRLVGPLCANDTEVMITALQNIGIEIAWEGDSLVVQGCGGKLPRHPGTSLQVGEAGTAARFLLPLLCLSTGVYEVQARGRMVSRPMEGLIAALQQMGGKIAVSGSTGGFPLIVEGVGSLDGGVLEMDAEVSSQFISALLLAAPYARREVIIKLRGKAVSTSYLELTCAMMADFGVQCRWLDNDCIVVPGGQHYRGRSYEIAGDASSASYFFAMAAISGGSMLVNGIVHGSRQGDLGLLEVFTRMGCQVEETNQGIRLRGPERLKSVDVDMQTMSDVAPTLAVAALFAEGTTIIRGVEHMRWKECDRLAVLCSELGKVGGDIQASDDELVIRGGRPLRGAVLDTYGDHRMAMAFSLLSLKVEGIEIVNPRCVEKTYPEFFRDFFAASGTAGVNLLL